MQLNASMLARTASRPSRGIIARPSIAAATRRAPQAQRRRRVAARIAAPERPPTRSEQPLVSSSGADGVDGVSLNMDWQELLSPVTTCPLGCVEAIMHGAPSHGETVLLAKPSETLQAIIPRLSKVTGLPVVGLDGRVVGVISRKDIIKVRQQGGSLQERVKAHMTSPAITVTPGTAVEEAGQLMLREGIRRLPVVDADGKPLGIVSRSDIFAPLMQERYKAYKDQEIAAVLTGEGLRMTWDVKYLYDGECSMCLTLKGVLERQDREKRIRFVDISDIDYDPMANMGVEFEDAMTTIHAIRPDGRVLQGTEALRALFGQVGLGWVVTLMESPVLAKLVDLIYDFLSANRIKIGGAMDALVAAKRVTMAKAGVEVCGDVDGGCEIEWGELGDDDAVSHV